MDLEHYLVHGTGQTVGVKDVVQRYRNQLERSPATYAGAAKLTVLPGGGYDKALGL